MNARPTSCRMKWAVACGTFAFLLLPLLARQIYSKSDSAGILYYFLQTTDVLVFETVLF